MTPLHVLASDEGTTSTQAIAFDGCGRAVASARCALRPHYRDSCRLEHDLSGANQRKEYRPDVLLQQSSLKIWESTDSMQSRHAGWVLARRARKTGPIPF